MEKLKINGCELAYELVGEGEETVVLLNGIGMSMAHWRPTAAILGQGRRVLLNDLRGQLQSSRPAGPYSFELHSRDLAGLLRSLGIPSAHIVGTSYGSEVAMVFARLHPQMTRSLVVIDGVSEVRPLLRAAVKAWRSAALVDPVAFYHSLIPWTYSESYIAANEAALASREKAMAGLPRDYFEAFAALCDSFLALDETPRLGDIKAPSLVLVGAEDILKHPGYARVIAEGIAGACLELLPGLGHGAVIEDPKAVCARILAFYSRLGGHPAA